MKPLYEISDDIRQLLSAITYNEELDEEEARKLLEEVETQFDEKVENICKFIINTEANILTVDAEVRRLNERKQRLTKKTEWLRRYVKEELVYTGKTEWDGAAFRLKVSKSPTRCDVVDEDLIPAEFKEEVTKVKVKKREIINAFKETGETPPGVNVVDYETRLKMS